MPSLVSDMARASGRGETKKLLAVWGASLDPLECCSCHEGATRLRKKSLRGEKDSIITAASSITEDWI